MLNKRNVNINALFKDNWTKPKNIWQPFWCWSRHILFYIYNRNRPIACIQSNVNVVFVLNRNCCSVFSASVVFYIEMTHIQLYCKCILYSGRVFLFVPSPFEFRKGDSNAFGFAIYCYYFNKFITHIYICMCVCRCYWTKHIHIFFLPLKYIL